jgi:hypothetical protein
MRPPVPTHPEDDRLLELAYGEAPDSEARALRQHVDGCARCKQFVEGIAEVRTAFRSVPTDPAPERGLESLLAYGEQAAARARSRRGGLRILALLSAAAAFAVVWLVLPSPHRPSDGLARAPVAGPAPASMSRPSDALAQAEASRAPAQGDRVRDEVDDQAKNEKERELKGLSHPAVAPLAKAERREEPSKQKGKVKLDAPAEQPKVATAAPAGAPVEAEGAGHSAAASSGALGNATASGGKVGAAGAGVAAGGEAQSSETLAMKKRADSSDKAAAPPASFAAASPPAETRGTDARAQQAAKIASAPLADAVASEDKDVRAVEVGSSSAAGSASKPAPTMQSMRMGAGSPEKQARLAEIDRQLASAKGDQRKALLMEKCEIQASLQLGPDAVGTCSMVSREFPGTPEAKRASDLARGFSVQLPAREER